MSSDQQKSSAPQGLFDRRIVAMRRARAAHGFSQFSFLFDEVAERLVERLSEVKRTFNLALDLGTQSGALARRLPAKNIIASDITLNTLKNIDHPKLVIDEEALPIRDASLDLVTSNLSLHFVNDLPGTLIQLRRALKPDGLFLASLFGGNTLNELRAALMKAEIDVTGGAGPRVSPMADIKDLGGLLTRAGFALPVADVDNITVEYGDVFSLLRDLRGMGQQNALVRRGGSLSRDILGRLSEIYSERFASDDGGIRATFEVIYLTGWAPDASQPQPLKPGSAMTSMADVLDKS
jgi:NADH dehydrogenase [ubiquinone] 1 alpha subcomplex assembly factor 5